MTLMLDLNKDSGVSLDLTKASPGLNNVKILLNWDEHPVHSNNTSQGFDLDLWAFALDSNGKVNDTQKIVYFNNMNYNNGAIVLPRDNRTGTGDDDEEITVDLSKLPADVSTIALYVFVFQGAERNQHFGMIANANVKVINNVTGDVIAQYNITQDCNGATALCIGNLDRTIFTPDGGAGTMDPNQVLQHYT